VFRAQIGTMNRRALEGQRARQQEPGALQELLRPGDGLLAVQPSPGADHRVFEEAFAKKPELADANIKVLKAG